MPSQLLTLQTDLTSLKYGQDRPAYGSSGQPFIQSPLPENATSAQKTKYELIRTSIDFPVRGGSTLYNGLIVPLTAEEDRKRIERFLKSGPRGLAFIQKQELLQLANPKTEVGYQVNVNAENNAGNFLETLVARGNLSNLENTRIFNNGTNLLKQVGAMGSGAHFDRHGTVPVNPFQSTYQYVVSMQNVENDKTGNRLRILYELKINNTGNIPLAGTQLQQSNVKLETINALGLSRNPNLLFQYIGGPNSIAGNGYTYIRRLTNSTGLLPIGGNLVNNIPLAASQFVRKPVLSKDDRLVKFVQDIFVSGSVKTGQEMYKYNTPNNTTKKGSTQELIKRYEDTVDNVQYDGTSSPFSYTLNYKQIIAKDTTLKGAIGSDFRSELPTGSNVPSSSIDHYISLNKGIGNPGSKNIKRTSYNLVGKGSNNSGVDSINMLDVGVNPLELPQEPKDLINFLITAVEVQPRTQLDGTSFHSTVLAFRAFITNFRDNHNADYSSHKYVGRAENFYTYQGVDRQISLSFKIAAQSRVEMRPLYRKLNYLVSQVYPSYSELTSGAGNGFMRAPLVKMTVGDYLYDQPGLIKNINISVNDEYPWEIALDKTGAGGADDDMYQLPQVLDIDMTFIPIHNFLPRRSFWLNGQNYNFAPFITPNTSSSGSASSNIFGI